MSTTVGAGTSDIAQDAPRADEAHPVPGGRARPSWQQRRIGYVRPLDGLRAVAVTLVVAYHLGFSGVSGGYIGVEVFFVISGWLVCALLMNEHHRTGSIAVGGFWLRRLRRLVPAMVAVVAATLAVASVVDPDRLAALRAQAIAALGYHLNWRLVVDQESYFDAVAGPSALEHLWSLSIEEQFYLLFPLLAVAVLAQRTRRRAVRLVVALALVSTLLRFVLVTPGDDPSRAYFGTDSRLSGLLLGVALGLFWTPNRLRPHDGRGFTAALDAVAVAGALTVAWYALTVDEHAAGAFRGAFTVVQLGTLALLAVVVYPAPTVASRVLSTEPLVWIGERSYGIYLIHWPVIVFLSDAPGEQPDGLLSVAAQVALILGLAALSYRYLEQPVRRRGFAAWGRSVRGRLSGLAAGRPAAAVAFVVVAVLAVTATASVTRGVVTASPPGHPGPDSVVIGPGEATTTVPTTTAAPGSTDDETTEAQAASLRPTTTLPPPKYVATTAVGDSVLVGAAQALANRMGGALTVDAAIGRQLWDATDVVAAAAADGTLGDVVVVHLGTNGPFAEDQVDDVLDAVGPDRLVLLVNVAVPRRWESEVNDALASAADRHDNVRLVDWHSLVASEPGLIREDGFHVTVNGAERYTDLLVGQIPTA